MEELIRQGKKDNRFELSLENPAESLEILFLDLRLFAGMSQERERIFLQRILKIAENFKDVEDPENMWSWRGFTDDEIARVKEWIENKEKDEGETDEYISALTFLPRILVLMDVSLPIILFSSTGRRDITDNFRDYETIVTDFSKPRFTVDVPRDIADQTKRRFEAALRKPCRYFGHAKNVRTSNGTVLI